MKILKILILCACIFALPLTAMAEPGKQSARGLNPDAMEELVASGVDKYLGMYSPVVSEDVGDGWTKHTFDPDGGNGPICIAGTPFSAFSKQGNPSKLLIMLQGGGACWQDFYFCNILAEAQEPPPEFPAGIWTDEFDTGSEVVSNPIGDWSVLYMPYCDGSVFTGDNDVVDPNFPFGPVRFHRGMRNVSAGIDLANTLFPNAGRIMLAGSSAGGVGAASLAPFITRFAYGNTTKLMVFNDAGPIAVNLFDVGGIAARAADWQFGQFYPASCTECSDTGQGTAIVDWRLENDSTIREAFYSTDGDATNRFFLQVPTQEMYRNLIVTEHGKLHDAYPDRYKRFIRSGDDSHTALQTPLFYLGTANGVPLDVWTADFLVPRPFWMDIVEDFVPLP
ncbi:MAG: pectinacetylesterase family protein [Gammaproteobacteria bacterium]|nr:pectinacetylesterase family protein [Gammaproteobacteria bacterium]